MSILFAPDGANKKKKSFVKEDLVSTSFIIALFSDCFIPIGVFVVKTGTDSLLIAGVKHLAVFNFNT